MRRFVLPENHPPIRLDKALVELLGLSRARAKKLLDDDAVRVNGRRSKKGLDVVAGDVIEVKEGAAESTDTQQPPAPQADLPVRVVHEDANVVVVDKPAGMASHPLQAGETGTVANFLAAKFPACLQANPEALREAGLVHRLDRDTSGVIVIAKRRSVASALGKLFATRHVRKTYWAVVKGVPKPAQGRIDVALVKAHITTLYSMKTFPTLLVVME